MAGYTRQDDANNISNGSVIDAADLNGEFNTLDDAFNASTGHNHDGTSGEGAAITKVGPAQDLVVSGSQVLPKTTNTLDLGSASVQFKDAFFDGTVDTDTLLVSGAATVSGTLIASSGVTGNLTGNVTGTVSDVSNHDTGDIAEGSNLYYTDARARAAITVTGSLSYNPSTGAISFTQGNTDTVAEGSTNLYYTDARATAAAITAVQTGGSFSVVDNGGDGSITFNGGVLTYTGPSASDVRAHLSAGTGVTYSAGQFSIGQSVGTTSDVTFNNATVNGNLTVNGTTTTVNSNAVNIGDATLTLNSDETGAPSQDAGIVIERGTELNKSLLWDESREAWSVFGERIEAGTFEGPLVGNASSASQLQIARTIALTGDVTGSVSFSGASNVNITTTIADDSHNHTISNIDGLQTEIDTKAEKAGSASQAFSASTLNATTVDLGAWTISETAGVLYFAFNGTNKMKIDGSGNITTVGNIVAYGTV